MFELSEKKKEILESDKHLLICGGPGSGKTTIAILKADLLVSKTLRPGQKVLFLSFARASVARVREALDEHSVSRLETRKNVVIETYHAFFWQILRSHGYLLGLPRKLEILTPAGQAVALSQIRTRFGDSRKLSEEVRKQLEKHIHDELMRLAFDEGRICFDLFADLVAQLLGSSTKIRNLVSLAYPVVILDEFQDTSDAQWQVVQQLGVASKLIALADAQQRIFDFAGADPERLNHFRERFAPREVDLGGENFRSADTEIVQFGNDILTGTYREKFKYEGVRVHVYPSNQDQALATLKGQTLSARKRLLEARGQKYSLAVLVPTKRLMRQVSDQFREHSKAMPSIRHQAVIDMEGAILAAEVIAFLMHVRKGDTDFAEVVELVCNFFCGKGGDGPSNSDIAQAQAIRKALAKAVKCGVDQKQIPAKSIIQPLLRGFNACAELERTGNPERDWVAIRSILAESGCKRLAEIAEEARNIRLLERGTELRDSLALEWRSYGSYANALTIVRRAFVREHFAMSNRLERGVIVMNMHKAKGKQFDEVIVFEGWPRVVQGKTVSNPDRIVRTNIDTGDLTHARYNFRVSVTRARMRTTVLTPDRDPCILLLKRR